jgi:hypothetical protein
MIEVRVGARVVIRSVYGVIWEVANIDAYNAAYKAAYMEYEDEALKFLRKKSSLAVVVERIDRLEARIFNSGVGVE